MSCPGSTTARFQDHAERAKTSCIISALGGVGQINLSATLAP